MPGLVTTKHGTGDYKWLLHTHGIREATTCVVDVSTLTKGTHYPDGFLPSGLILNIADVKAAKPFTGASGEVLGFVMGDWATDGVTDVNVAVLTHGQIRTAFLPVKANLPATAPNGFYFTEGV